MNWFVERGLSIFGMALCLVFGVWGLHEGMPGVAESAMFATAIIAAGEVIARSIKTNSKSGNVVIGWNNIVKSEASAVGPTATDVDIHQLIKTVMS